MKIISSIGEDGWHDLGSASYEWWYFDALSSDGYGFVITFFYGLPFSPYYSRAIANFEKSGIEAHPGNHCAFYFCLYGRRGTECYALNEYSGSQFSARRDRPEVRIGKCSLDYDPLKGYLLAIDAPARFGKRVKGRFLFQPEIAPKIEPAGSSGDHVWNCVAPRCLVDGSLTVSSLLRIRELEFHGTGYHDHNYGARPLHIDMVRWHWGRLHTADETAIYYIVETERGEREGLLATIANDGRNFYCGRADYEAKETRHLMGVRYFSEIEMRAKDPARTVQLSVSNRRAVDESPFYLRFLADQELVVSANRDGARKYRAVGFAEAFEPHKLFVKAFWPFIKMRIRKFGS